MPETATADAFDAPPSAHRLERPGRLVPAVVAGLLGRIVAGEFPPGTLLPKESELIEEYGVSRTVIREALRVVEGVDAPASRPFPALPRRVWRRRSPS